ncbi:MAG: hypothetical protein CMJ30_05460 [Phycisphaerae bacterium]|nr:hypothetical protein [Phycisphaerae bacterium]
MTENDPSNHFSADEEWKSEAEAERARLAEADAKAAAGADQTAIPEATFDYFVIALASQAMMAMAMRPDPSGQVFIDLNAVDLKMAEHHIDLLAVLEEKCKGNLTEEESSMLSETLHGLRSQFVQVQSQAQEHLAKHGGGLTPDTQSEPPPSAGDDSAGGSSGLIIP